MDQPSGRLTPYYARYSGLLNSIEHRTAIDGKAGAGDQFQDQQEEAERYRRAIYALLDKG
jgi:hypothetical protein